MAEDPAATPVVPNQTLEGETRLTKIGTGLATAVGVLGAAVVAFADELGEMDLVLQIGFFAILAVAVLAVTYMVVADVRARADIKVAQIRAAAASPAAGGTLSQWSSTSTPMAVRVTGDTGRFGVLALRHDAEGRTWYLVGRRGQRPKWVHNEEVEDTYYGEDPSNYEPAVANGPSAP